jgi:hypothetical protein
VNNIQVPSNETVTVENGDIVLFGMQETFRVDYESLVFCCSGMTLEEKKALKLSVKKLGCYVF